MIPTPGPNPPAPQYAHAPPLGFQDWHKLDIQLQRLIAAHHARTLTDEDRIASQLRPGDLVLVLVLAEYRPRDAALLVIQAAGGMVGACNGESIDALIPLTTLGQLENSPAIRSVRIFIS